MEDLGNQIPSGETLYKGFSRTTFLKYFLFIIALKAVFGLMLTNSGSQHLNEILILAFALIVPISFWAVAQRLKNIGVQQKRCVLLLVPVLNFFVLSGCLICPQGYWETKKLDRTGKVSAVIIAILTVVLIAVGIMGMAKN